MPLSLRLLGALDLRDDAGGELRAVLVAPKRLALLAYLAAATPRGFHRRDRILALLWPELTPERARQALRSTLHKLRQQLGDGIVVARGAEELAVDGERLWCDVVECERALEEGRLEDAAALHAGDMLAGFWLSDSPELERWIEERRAALRRRVLGALRELAERESATGTHARAAEWTRRAASLAPDDEEVLRALMEALERGDDRLGALSAYRDFARRLQAEYDAAPSPATAAVAERIRAASPEARTPAGGVATPDSTRIIPTPALVHPPAGEGRIAPADAPHQPYAGPIAATRRSSIPPVGEGGSPPHPAPHPGSAAVSASVPPRRHTPIAASIVIPATTEEYRALRAGRHSVAQRFVAIPSTLRRSAAGGIARVRESHVPPLIYLLAAIGLLAIFIALAALAR